MLAYKQFLENKQQLSEGGNAVKGVGPINQENSIPTYNKILSEFLPKLKLKNKHVASLGSTGKKGPKQTSGDIDIALDATELLKSNKIDTYADLMDFIVVTVKSLGYDYKDMRSIGIVSIAYPIVNDDKLQADKLVQVDFMVVENLKHATWAFHSPSYLESNLKGLYRNELNFAVAKYAGFKVTERDKESKEAVTWQRFWWDIKRGLSKGTQTRLSAKTGKIVKGTRPLTKNDISDEPDDIVKFLYGEKYKARDILTFDDALNAIMSNDFPYKKQRKTILKAASESIQKKGFPIPKQMAKHI
jgi:hypothetical protein